MIYQQQLLLCKHEYEKQTGSIPTREQTKGLNDLNLIMNELYEHINKYKGKWGVTKFLTAKTFLTKYKKLNEKLRDAMTLIHIGLNQNTIQQINELNKKLDAIPLIEERLDKLEHLHYRISGDSLYTLSKNEMIE